VPTVTSSRVFPAKTMSAQHYIDSYAPPTDQEVRQFDSQITTSYRSKNRNRVDESADSFVSESGNRTDFMKELREENRTLGYDTGHEFQTERWTYECGMENARLERTFFGTQLRSYNGWIEPSLYFTHSPFVQPAAPSITQINADGARLFGMTRPTEPEAGAAAFLGELREGLPKILGLSTLRGGVNHLHQNIGGEHLNVQFGVKPLISDLQKTALGVLRAAKIARQYIRDSDRLVRRRATLLEDSTLTRSEYPGTPAIARRQGTDVIGEFMSGPYGVTSVNDQVYQKVWFSGAYTYHVSQAESFVGKLERYEALANHALGTRFDPDVAWQLTPWSWLIDWFSDAGGFISNVNALANDSLVMKYGYVMHETLATRTRTLGLRPIQVGPSVCWSTFQYHRKMRHRATPYGFGTNLGDLSPRRWAILGALGLTKSPNALH
jgi:hypothetical protein